MSMRPEALGIGLNPATPSTLAALNLKEQVAFLSTRGNWTSVWRAPVGAQRKEYWEHLFRFAMSITREAEEGGSVPDNDAGAFAPDQAIAFENM
nr:hypothetical protein [Rhizobium populisoli]